MAETDTEPIPDREGPGIPRWVQRVGLFSWYFIGFCGAVALLALVFAASRDIMIPLILGVLFAVVLARPMRWLVARGLPPGLAAALIVLSVVGVIAGVVLIIVVGLTEQGAELAARIDVAIDDIRDWVDGLDIDPGFLDQARSSIDDSSGTVTAGLANEVVGVINSAAGLVSGSILGLIVLYYLLKDGDRLVDRFIDGQAPARRGRYRRIADDSARRIQAYARGRTIMAVVNGAAIGLVAAVIGVPLAFAITVVNFVGSYVPYLGAFVGGAFAFLLALSGGGLTAAVVMVATALFVNLALENALEPRLLGDQLDLHPLVVLVVTVLGGLSAGMVGLILAAPLTSIGLNLYREMQASGFFD